MTMEFRSPSAVAPCYLAAMRWPEPEDRAARARPSMRIATCLLPACLWAVACAENVVIVAPPDVGQPPVDAAVAVDTPPPVPPREPPVLQVLTPERGAFLGTATSAALTMTVAPTTSAMTALSVNGLAVTGLPVQPPPSSGAPMSASVTLRPGVNPIAVRLEAKDGGRTVDGRAVHAGSVRPPDAPVAGGLRLHLSPEFLDDDDATPDDLAGLGEALLTDPQVLSALTEPINTEFAVLTPTSITIASSEIDITPTDGGLDVKLVLHGALIAFVLEGKGGFATLFTGPGSIAVETATLTTRLVLHVADGKATGVAEGTTFVTEGFVLKAEAMQKILDQAPSLVDYVKEYLEKTLAEKVSSLIGSLVGGLIGGFATELTLGGDGTSPWLRVPITLKLALVGARVAAHGINVDLDVHVVSTLGAGVPFGPAAGGLISVSQPLPDDFSTAPMGLAIDDDVLNQALFALWYGGAVTDLTLGLADLGGVDPKSLPDVFQPFASMGLSMGLPMTVGPAADDAATYELAFGEVATTINTSTGKSFALSLNARAPVKLALGVADDGGPTLLAAFDSRPKALELAFGCSAAPSGIDPGSVAALMRLGFGPLLDSAAKALVFRIPPLALSKVLAYAAFEKRDLTLRDATLSVRAPERHWLVLEGRALVVTRP